MTGLPMVFAVWAGRADAVNPQVAEAFTGSCQYGRARIEEIVSRESASRGFPPELVREYLTSHIVHELGPRDFEGMELFLKYASAKSLP
jgi:predicted solute-binding protein